MSGQQGTPSEAVVVSSGDASNIELKESGF